MPVAAHVGRGDDADRYLNLLTMLLSSAMPPPSHQLLATLSQQLLRPTIQQLVDRFLDYEVRSSLLSWLP